MGFDPTSATSQEHGTCTVRQPLVSKPFAPVMAGALSGFAESLNVHSAGVSGSVHLDVETSSHSLLRSASCLVSYARRGTCIRSRFTSKQPSSCQRGLGFVCLVIV
eukprot:scaffold117574_cov32-Tisochrysis_lutea.AAC.6